MKQAILGKALLGCGMLMLAACETTPDVPPHPLDGTSWRLIDVETSGTSTRLSPQLQARHTLTFMRGGKLQMQLDCNRGNADWSASMPETYNGTLVISQVASTRALCPEPSFGEDLAADLPSAMAYTLTPDGKGLVIRARRVAFAFARN